MSTMERKNRSRVCFHIHMIRLPSKSELSSSEDFLKLLRQERGEMHRTLFNVTTKQNSGEILPAVDHFWCDPESSESGILCQVWYISSSCLLTSVF